MLIDTGEGGTLRSTPEGHPWIEEYPGSKGSYVLNGFLFSLIAVLEAESTGINLRVPGVQLEQSLFESIGCYFCGKYLRYDRLTGKFCSPHYMGLHTLLFTHLHVLTGRKGYDDLAGIVARNTLWGLYFDSIRLQPTAEDQLWLRERFG